MTRAEINRRRLAIAAVAAGAAAAVILYLVPPTEGSWYPGCTFYKMTGLHCPGCGATRCVHALLHGELLQAAAYNVFLVLLLPYIGLAAVLAWWEAVTGRRVWHPQLSQRTLYIILGLLAGFWILRNLPWYPFTLLAPHVL